MDREQARFILQSLRPDGTDVASADFEEALIVAAQDSVLGEWLSAERRRDAVIAEAFEDVPVPPDLIDEILTQVSLERGARAPSEELVANDAGPAEERSLRQSEPLTVTSDGSPMTVLKVEIAATASGSAIPGPAPGYIDYGKRKEGILKVALLAGLLVVGAFATFELTSSNLGPTSGKTGRITLRELGQGALFAISQELPFELQGNELYGYQDWLRAEGGPRVDFKDLPGRISGGRLLGCRVSTIGGTRASHLCFDLENTPVHVFVVPTMPIKDSPAGWRVAADCWTCPETGCAVVAQRSESRIWFFLSAREEKSLADLVREPKG